MSAVLIHGPIVVGDYLRRITTGTIYRVHGETGHGTDHLGGEYQNVHMTPISGKGRTTSKWRASVRREFERVTPAELAALGITVLS